MLSVIDAEILFLVTKMKKIMSHSFTSRQIAKKPGLLCKFNSNSKSSCPVMTISMVFTSKSITIWAISTAAVHAITAMGFSRTKSKVVANATTG